MLVHAVGAFALFLSAFLLFSGELLFARILLPKLGGAPAVWTSSLFTYQVILVAGYGYAHFVGRVKGGVKAVLQGCLLATGFLFVPFALRISGEVSDAFGTSWAVAASVGVPFFVLSTSAPLLSSWVAGSHPDRDPFLLYSASNIGSLAALFLSPLVLDRWLGVQAQSQVWGVGYGLLGVLVVSLGWATRTKANRTESPVAKSLDLRDVAGWVVMSLIPASLLHGVTTIVTQDLAAAPLLWAVPLALYLSSYVLAFSKIEGPIGVVSKVLPFLLTLAIVLSLLHAPIPVWLSMPFHLGVVFLLCWVLHRRLFDSRPSPDRLTAFYFASVVGGAVGGSLNALVAPVLFASIREYPLVLALGLSALFVSKREVPPERVDAPSGPVDVDAMLAAAREEQRSASSRKVSGSELLAYGALFGILVLGLNARDLSQKALGHGVFVGLALLVAWGLERSVARTAVSAGLVLLIGQFAIEPVAVLHSERSFFGISRVIEDKATGLRSYLHGTTIHGRQSLDPKYRQQALSYYADTSPLGAAFSAWRAESRLQHVAVLGLGVGVLAAHSRAGEHWRFFEIDPVVEKIARDPRYFTYLSDAKATFDVVLGDARKSMEAPSEKSLPSYDLIVLDSFTSDAVPVHLLTREAFETYLARLGSSGVIAVNITNRSLELLPVVSAVAESLGLVGRTAWEQEVSAAEASVGKTPSRWVILTREVRWLESAERADGRWKAWDKSGAAVWTDDFSDVVSTIRFRRRG